MPPLISLFISIFLGVVGQLLLKKGLMTVGPLSFGAGKIIYSYIRIFISPYVISGIFTYLLGSLFWIYGLSKVDLSFAFPLISISYIMVLLASWAFLGETISFMRWIGVFTICLGVFLITKS